MTDNLLDQETPAHATNVSKKASRAKQLEGVGILVKQMLVILYPIGTILGLIYAHWYYKAFDISFLNHVTPLDLLLVALANANKITFIFAVTVPLTITVLFALYILVVARWGLAVLMAALIVVAKVIKILWEVLVVAMCYFLILVALMLSFTVALFTLPAVAFREDRTVALKWWKERATDRDGPVSTGLRNSMHWWRSARSHAKVSWSNLLSNFSNFVKDASNLFSKAESIKDSGNLFLRENRIGVFLFVLVVTSIFIAYKSGRIDSECVLEDRNFCTFGKGSGDFEGYFGDLLTYGGRLIPGVVGKQENIKDASVRSGIAIVVPTANVAALEFLDSNSKSGRKHVRVTIRQDAGNHSFTRCLTDVGATDSAQFLFDFDQDKELFAKKEECLAWPGAVSGGCEWTSRIGPFPLGSASLDGHSDHEEDLAGCKRGSSCVKGASERCFGLDAVECLVENINAKIDQGLIPAKLRLIGRADSLPISNPSFRSNDGLAQARAETVWELLRSMGWDWLDEVDALRLIGGPLSAGECDVCDRSVDVHICWKPAGSSGVK